MSNALTIKTLTQLSKRINADQPERRSEESQHMCRRCYIHGKSDLHKWFKSWLLIDFNEALIYELLVQTYDYHPDLQIVSCELRYSVSTVNLLHQRFIQTMTRNNPWCLIIWHVKPNDETKPKHGSRDLREPFNVLQTL